MPSVAYCVYIVPHRRPPSNAAITILGTANIEENSETEREKRGKNVVFEEKENEVFHRGYICLFAPLTEYHVLCWKAVGFCRPCSLRCIGTVTDEPNGGIFACL